MPDLPAYIDPKTNAFSQKQHYRRLFFGVTARTVPVVIEELRRNVLPSYLAANQKCNGDIDRNSILRPFVGGCEIRAALAKHPDAEVEGRDLLRCLDSWATRWHLANPWVLNAAKDTLKSWARGEVVPPKLGTVFQFAFYETRYDRSELLAEVTIQDSWQFLQESWTSFEVRCTDAVAAALAEYRARIERLAQERGYVKAVRKRSGVSRTESNFSEAHFEWLALFQCKGLSVQELSNMEALRPNAMDADRLKDPEQTIRKAIRRTAILIGLELRGRRKPVMG